MRSQLEYGRGRGLPSRLACPSGQCVWAMGCVGMFWRVAWRGLEYGYAALWLEHTRVRSWRCNTCAREGCRCRSARRCRVSQCLTAVETSGVQRDDR